MFKEYPACELPDKNTKIWRYLSFPKLLSMLEKTALHFTRFDNFTNITGSQNP